MQSRSPSIERICAAAVIHFAEQGYDGASLNEIAVQVGIRKASLYAHFAGKDALFREVFTDALEAETEFASECFAQKGEPGLIYCQQLASRYEQSPHLRFLLRAAYFPPAVLRAEFAQSYDVYLNHLQERFTTQLRQHKIFGALTSNDLQQFAYAYLGIVDSLHVDLIYAEARNFENRLKSLWRLLYCSLEQAASTSEQCQARPGVV